MADGLSLELPGRAFKKRDSGNRGIWGAALAAVLLSFFLFPDREASAFFTYGTELSYQQNDATTGATKTSTSQDRFSFYFNMQSNPLSRLTMIGILRLDVLEDINADGTKSTQLQPNVDLRFSTRATQLGLGYRKILTNTNVISGNVTKTQTTDESDSYVESSLTPGRLPSLRLRYSLQDATQSESGVGLIANTSTRDFLASTNYRLGIFIFNGDYRDELSKDKVKGSTTDSTQISGQVSFSKRLGSKIDLGMRENYSYNQETTNGVLTTRQTNSIAEARGNFNPFAGATISSSYVFRITDDLTAGRSTERTWATTANYALPKFLRLYGSYVTRTADSPATASAPSSTNSGDDTIAGAAFNHAFGRFTFASRYEMRFDSSSSNTGGITTKTSSTQDNFDWSLTARPAKFLGLLLSESYVSNTSNGSTTDTNQFRLRTDIGPLRSLVLGPYVEYTASSTSGGTAATTSSTTTNIVVPAMFHVNLHQKLDFSIADTFNMTINQSSGASSTTSQSNNAVLRLLLSQPLPNTTVEGDATFTTASTSTTPATSTSTYTLRTTWVKNPHILNANLNYQTSSNAPASMGFVGQYGLNFRLKKLFLGFQARYEYSTVFSTPSSSSQTIFVLLNLRK